jgi:hypothetical protein
MPLGYAYTTLEKSIVILFLPLCLKYVSAVQKFLRLKEFTLSTTFIMLLESLYQVILLLLFVSIIISANGPSFMQCGRSELCPPIKVQKLDRITKAEF